MRALKTIPDKSAARPKQDLSADLVNGLLRIVRQQFCPDMGDKEWFSSHNQFIKVKVIMWPARFVVAKGFTMSPERYNEVMLGILQEIKRHGQTGVVRYWPGYLMKCVQEHFRHHWEEYYNEAKAIGNRTEAALMALRGLPGDPGAKVVESLALAQRVLSAPKKRKGKVTASQGELTF